MRHVGLAEDHGSGGTQARDHGGVASRHVVGQEAGPRRRPYPSRLDGVLDRTGHAMEGAPPLLPRPGLVSRTGPSERLGLGQGHDGIELWIEALDALEHACGEFDGGHLTPADGAGDRQCGSKIEVGLVQGGSHRRGCDGLPQGREAQDRAKKA